MFGKINLTSKAISSLLLDTKNPRLSADESPNDFGKNH